VSVDILLRYKENRGGERQTSSVWLQMSGESINRDHNTTLQWDGPKNMIRREGIKKKARVKHSRKERLDEYGSHEETINHRSKYHMIFRKYAKNRNPYHGLKMITVNPNLQEQHGCERDRR